MNINQLIFRNLKKNLKNYYLYVFALIFSVTLYFSFVTLQFDPALDQTKGTIKGAAGIRAASILLVAIVTVFLLYANNIFIKRRSKEIGLFQLIGMTKGRIFGILSAENFILYYSSMFIGIFAGFSISKLIIMVLFKITNVDAIASLHFSLQALLQTVLVFSAIFLFILLMNFVFIKRQTILSLFRVLSSTEGKMKNLSSLEIVLGTAGFLLIGTGYYLSSKLFGGDFVTMLQLFTAMVSILASVIIGTFLFYKGTISFIFHLIRKKKAGYLTINEVLSLSSIMFRMKSNSALLTIITTVSALAIGLLSLSYISYYSAEKTAQQSVAADFSFTSTVDSNTFKKTLATNHIEFREKKIEVLQVNANLKNIMESKLKGMKVTPEKTPISVISDRSVPNIDVAPKDSIFTGYNDLLQRFMGLKDSGPIELKGQKNEIPLHYLGQQKKYYISWYFTNGGTPVAIVDDTIYKQLKNDLDPSIQKESSLFIGFHLKNKENMEKANDLFKQIKFSSHRSHDSYLEMANQQKRMMGLAMFIVGFLGLTFLITSGCILYFKQMGESEEEKPSYTILRKLGFTSEDLHKGIQFKQLFNFGIPLIVGLTHSYFAVQSGWFLFGSELWTPMIIVMVLYAALYSIFGFLSAQYYKKVIRESL